MWMKTSVAVGDLLRQSGHDAMTVDDQRLAGSLDPAIAAVCRCEGLDNRRTLGEFAEALTGEAFDPFNANIAGERRGADIPVCLDSSRQECLLHRRAIGWLPHRRQGHL